MKKEQLETLRALREVLAKDIIEHRERVHALSAVIALLEKVPTTKDNVYVGPDDIVWAPVWLRKQICAYDTRARNAVDLREWYSTREAALAPAAALAADAAREGE